MTTRKRAHVSSASPRKRRWFIPALLLAAAGAGWIASTSSTQVRESFGLANKRSGVVRTSDDSRSAANPTRSGTLPLIPLGAERRYALRYATNVTAEGNMQLVSFAIDGDIKLASIHATDQRILGGQFHGKLAVAGAAEPGSAGEQALNEAVQRPFVLIFGEDGRLRQASGAAGVPVFIGRLWQAFGEYLQVVRDHGDSWETHERDASGAYLAHYRQNGGELVKQKLKYESFSSERIKSYTVREFAQQFYFDGGNTLEDLSLNERLGAAASDGPFAAFDSNTQLTLKAAAPAHAAVETDWAQVLASAEPFKTNGGQDPVAYERARAGNLTLTEAYARLSDLGSKDKSTRDRAERAFVTLTALLRQDPKNLAFIAEKLTTDGPLTEPLLAALRDASTPESQKLLAKMAGASSPLKDDNRLEAARSLSRVATPTFETVEALKALRGDQTVGVQATYGLGSALHRLEEQDPALAETTRETLATQLSEAKTPDQQVAVLKALGNAGASAMLDAVRGYVSSASPAVRAAAAQGLRRIPGAEADLLLAQLSRDPVEDVRYSAVDAIRERSASPPLSGALSERALTETRFAIRARAINALSAWLSQDASIASTLRLVAERDPSQDLRNVARNALARAG